MSQQIDNQIVKMQFDNASFEKNVQQSMSTLDKLKQALKFEKVNMTPLQEAFSETEATATKAGFHIQDIWLKMGNIIEQEVAQKIVNAGKKVVNALTLEGISDGFKEYELKMGSIQTIMAGTGESLATVNKYLEDLNTYSDQTIYSFSDMTQNIGKFTNAGVKLKDAVNAIKGIANEAAVSGANANEASRAMYNFAQALSAGYVKLIDWKSIENANMATKEFKETLLEMGTAMGTVAKDSDGMYRVLTENNQGKTMKDLVSGTKNFNDSLQYQWMTTEVLTSALEIYATDIRKLTDGELADYEKKLKETYKFSDEQVEKFEQLGVKAADAATEIKTFSMLMDTLKEAIGSGWAMTWQYFIGDFEQAKALFTGVGNVLGSVIDSMSQARNDYLRAGLQTGWEKFTNLDGMAIPESEKYREILVDLARDQNKLTKEQYVAINSTETLMKSFHELGWVTGDLLTESVDDYYNILKSMSDEELAEAGISDDQLKQLEKLNQGFKDGTLNAEEFAKSMINLGGRENVIQGLKNLFHSLSDTLKPIGDAFDDVFGIMDPQKLFDLTERFRKFTEEMLVSENAANTLKTSFTLVFTGIKTALGSVGTAIKGVTKLILPIFNLFDALFGLIGKVISALTGSKGALDAADKFTQIGDKISDKYLWAMQKLADFIDRVAEAIRNVPESTVFTKIHDGVESAITALNEFWNAFVNMPIIQQMITDFNNSIAEIESKVTPVVEAVENSFNGLKDNVKKNFNLSTLNSVLTTVYNKLKNLITLVKDFTTRIKTFFTGLKDGKTIVQSFKDSFGDIIDRIKELKQNLKEFFEDLFAKGDELGGKFDLAGIQQAIHDFVTNITPEQVTMIAVAGTFMLIALNLLRLSEALKNAVDAFTGIGLALKNVINSYIKKQKSTILQVAEAIVIVAAALWVLSTIPKDRLDAALGAVITITALLGGLTVVLTACGIAMQKLGGGKSMVELATGLALVSGAFMVVALTLKLLEKVNLKGILPKILTMAGIMVGLVGLSTLMSKIDKFNKGSLTMLAVSASLLLAAEALAKIGEIPSEKLDQAMSVMLKMMLGLAAVTYASGKVGIFSAVGLIAIVLAMDKLLPSLEKLVNYDYDEIEKGLDKNKKVLGKLAVVIGAMVVIGAIAGNRIKGAAISLLALAGTFGILVGITKLVSLLKPQELAKGEAFLWSMAGLISLIELCSSKSRLGMFGGKAGGEGSKVFIRLAVTMGILLGIAKLASMMEVRDIIKGELAVLGLVGIVAAMVEVAKRSAKSEGVMRSVSAMLFTLSLILAEVAILSMIPLDNMAPALTAVLGIMGALALLALAISKNTKVFDKATMNAKGAGALIVAMAMVAVLGGMMIALSKENPENVTTAAKSLMMIIGAVAALSAAMSKISGGFNAAQLEVFVGSVFLIAIVSAILSRLTKFMKDNDIDPNTMLKAAAGISVVLVGITPALLALSRFKTSTDWKAMGAAVIAAIAVLASVAASIGLLARYGGDADSILKSAIAISIGMVAICAPMAVLAAVGKICKGVDFNSMATIVGSAIVTLAGVTAAIWFLSNQGGDSDKMIASAKSLAIALFAISVPIAVLGVIGKLCGNIGGAGLGAMAIATAGAIVALGAIANTLVWFAQNIDEASINVLNNSIPVLVTAIAGVGVLALAISAAGLLSGGSAAIVGAGFLAVVAAIVALGAIVAAIAGLGYALQNITSLEGALTTGLDMLVIIAEKIGEAIGAFIGGIGVGITKQLEPMADNLITFSERMITFSDNMAKVNKDAVDGCKNIAAAMLFITAADFLEGIGRLVGFGSIDFNFAPLGKAVSDFCNAVKDVPGDAVTKASACSVIAKRLAEVSGSLDAKGGLAGLIFGDKQSLDDFATGVGKFGLAIISFCNSVKNLPGNAVELAQNARDASIPLIELTQSLVAQGGLWQSIAGNKDLNEFGTSIVGFVQGLTAFVRRLLVLENIAPNYGEIIQRCSDAVSPLIDLANGLENMGGILSGIIGDNTLNSFGDTLIPFSEGLSAFIGKMKGVESLAPNYKDIIIDTSVAASYLVRLANSLENMGGIGSWFSGDNTLSKFGDTLADFGYGLSNFAELTANVSSESIMNLIGAITELIAIGSQAASIPSDAFSGMKFALEDLSAVSINAASMGIKEGTPDLITSLKELFSQITSTVDSFTTNDKRSFLLYGNEVINGIISGINISVPLLIERVSTFVAELKQTLNNAMPLSAFEIYGKNVPEGIAKGIRDNTNIAIEATIELGKNVGLGLKEGLESEDMLQLVRDSAENIANLVNNTIQEGLGENSPSKIAYSFGRFYDLGLANGIRDYASTVVASTEELSEDVVSTANSIISAIKDAIDSDIDSQPTIRPVLDTSDITAKARKISSLFDSSDLSLMYKASGSINQMRDLKYGNVDNSSSTNAQPGTTQINYTQNNYSPKALSRIDIYRDTKNALSMMKGVVRANA